MLLIFSWILKQDYNDEILVKRKKNGVTVSEMDD